MSSEISFPLFGLHAGLQTGSPDPQRLTSLSDGLSTGVQNGIKRVSMRMQVHSSSYDFTFSVSITCSRKTDHAQISLLGLVILSPSASCLGTDNGGFDPHGKHQVKVYSLCSLLVL